MWNFNIIGQCKAELLMFQPIFTDQFSGKEFCSLCFSELRNDLSNLRTELSLALLMHLWERLKVDWVGNWGLWLKTFTSFISLQIFNGQQQRNTKDSPCRVTLKSSELKTMRDRLDVLLDCDERHGQLQT